MEHSRIEAAQAPARRGSVARVDLGVIDCLLDCGAVDIERGTGRADFGQFEQSFPGKVALADTHLAPVEPSHGQVFTQRAGIQWIALRDELFDSFARDQQHGLIRSAVDLRMRPGVAPDAFGRDFGFGDGPLGNSAGRNVDLNDGAGHFKRADLSPDSSFAKEAPLAVLMDANLVLQIRSEPLGIRLHNYFRIPTHFSEYIARSTERLLQTRILGRTN